MGNESSSPKSPNNSIKSTHQDIKLSAQKYIIYWQSNSDPFNANQIETWDAYNQSNQIHLNLKYQQFLQNSNDYFFNLLNPLENYYVDFRNNRQINVNDKNKIRPIKMEIDQNIYEINQTHNEKNKQITQIEYPFIEKIQPISPVEEPIFENDIFPDDDILEKENSEENYANAQFENPPLIIDNQSAPLETQPLLEDDQIFFNNQYTFETQPDTLEDQPYLEEDADENNQEFNDENNPNFDADKSMASTEYSYNQEEFLFFWKANKNPWKHHKSPSWAPYDEEDQVILANAYQIFLQDNSKNTVELKNPANYFIDFSNMLQINKQNQNLRRQVQRCHPNAITNIIRKNRFYSSNQNKRFKPHFIEQQKINGNYKSYFKISKEEEKKKNI